jgi:aminoglycoside phosphotransferase
VHAQEDITVELNPNEVSDARYFSQEELRKCAAPPHTRARPAPLPAARAQWLSAPALPCPQVCGLRGARSAWLQGGRPARARRRLRAAHLSMVPQD